MKSSLWKILNKCRWLGFLLVWSLSSHGIIPEQGKISVRVSPLSYISSGDILVKNLAHIERWSLC